MPGPRPAGPRPARAVSVSFSWILPPAAQTYAHRRVGVYLECVRASPPSCPDPDPHMRGPVGLHRHPGQADHAAGAGTGVVATLISVAGAAVLPARVARAADHVAPAHG